METLKWSAPLNIISVGIDIYCIEMNFAELQISFENANVPETKLCKKGSFGMSITAWGCLDNHRCYIPFKKQWGIQSKTKYYYSDEKYLKYLDVRYLFKLSSV